MADSEKKDGGTPISPIRRFFNMMSLDRTEIGIVYLYAIFSGLINLSLPLGIQAIIGMMNSGRTSASWGVLIFIVVVGVAAAGTIQILQLSLTEILQRRIFARASFEFAYRIPRFKFDAIHNYYPPELMNRFFDTLTVQKGLSKIVIDFSASVLQVIFGLILLSFYHPFFVFFGLILIGLLTIIFFVTGPKGLKTSLMESKYKYQVAHWLEEMARVMTTFKLAGNTELPLEKTNLTVSNYLKYRKEHFKVLVFQFANIIGFKTIITAGLLILGSFLVFENEINLGQFVASEIIILLVINSVEKLIVSMDTVYDVLTGVEKMGQVTDIPLEQEKELKFTPSHLYYGVNIELRNVSFTYPNATQYTLRDINLKIKPGEKICIAGPNGHGKTTLISLLSGLFLDYEGSILYNDTPFRNMDVTSIRSVIGDNLNQQDLFQGTLFENICVGKPGISFEDLHWAIELVGLKEYFKGLPDGWDTKINPEGFKLPTSIKQKIILARTFAEMPRIVVIDDILNILMEEDKKRIIDCLTSDDFKWTLMVVSNDPAFQSRCDTVIHMKNGSIDHVEYNQIERGGNA